MARRAALERRQARTTLLVMGEGYAEVELLKHLRGLYTASNSGCSVTIRNAYGCGAGHVVDQAIKHSSQAAYDRKAALLDTDAGWTPAVQARAKRGRIMVVESVPCLEAWLLDVDGHGGKRDSDGHKRSFAQRYGYPAHDARVYQHFAREILDAARHRVATLDVLLSVLGA